MDYVSLFPTLFMVLMCLYLTVYKVMHRAYSLLIISGQLLNEVKCEVKHQIL